jgi:type II secretory pathway pseudopilin PulG
VLKQAIAAGERYRDESGFTLIELMISVLVLMVISGVVLQGMLGLGRVNDIVSNRTEMHSGVRNATELLQQEVGQAGRVSFVNWLLTGGVAGTGLPENIKVSSTNGMYTGMHLVVSDNVGGQETVTLAGVTAATNEITATFSASHPANARLSVTGGFAEGVIPRTLPDGVTLRPDGSTGTVLKIVGDINGDNKMVYVEYTCDLAARRLYRNSMPYDAVVKPAVTVEQVLLDNVLKNPGNPTPPCFTYQEETVNNIRFVIGVAITLTVETQDPDPITKEFQQETKALLNVSPRNVFNVWQMASLGYANRVQPLPPATKLLLP